MVQRIYRLHWDYGYDNISVYAVECSAGQILLDYDSLKEVYFLKKGEA